MVRLRISPLAVMISLVCTINGYFHCLRDGTPRIISAAVVAFVPNSCIGRGPRHYHDNDILDNPSKLYPLSMNSSSKNNGNNENPKNNDKSDDKKDNNNNNVVIEELSWRVAKVRLEEANTRRFLKRKPIKMSYSDSQKWIQRNWNPTTKQEFEDLVANGNLRTPYISKRPEEYYGARGEWISWDHYLLGECSSSGVLSDGKNGTDSSNGGNQEVLKWQ